MKTSAWVNRVGLGMLVVASCLLAGCPKQDGVLQVINDGSPALTELYIASNTSAEWGNNVLVSPLANGWLYEVSLAPGAWDILSVDTEFGYRMLLGVTVSPGQTQTVYVTSMTPVYDDEGEGEPTVEGEPITPVEGENPVEGEAVMEGESGGENSTGPRVLNGGQAFSASLPDGTRLTLPAVELQGQVTALTLSKTGDVPDLSATDLDPVGTARVVTFDSFDPVAKGVPMARFTPSLTFPASEAAGQNPDTLAAVRISDLIFDGQDMPGHVSYLPVNRKANGDLEVTDFFFPDSIISDLGQNAAGGKANRRPREIRYVLGTFDGSYDWYAEPILMRFYPKAEKAERRVLEDELSEEQLNAENAKEIQNVVLLVHGHNEEEKEFGYNPTASSPWYFGYKRDVWTPLYDYFLTDKPELLKCTAFFEFIYPSYKPIFTTSPTTPGTRLDGDFADRVNALIANLKPGYENLRLYIVAHSMGGLVSRAGIQLMNSDSQGAFQKLVTWGSPHLGTPLVTMRYILGAPGGIYRAGPEGGTVTLPLGNIDNTLYALRRAIDGMQVDAPGSRDLRYANSHTETPRNLKLDTLFSLDVDPAVNPDLWNKYDLHTGTEIYNENLRILNGNENYRLSGKYFALYGVTSKRARVELTWYYKPYLEGNDIARGALVYPWLIEGADQPYEGYTQGASDGAVNITSMAGVGVMGGRYCVGDIDHEEYYGAPKPHGNFQRLDLARKTASDTLYALNMQSCEVNLHIDSLEPSSGPIGGQNRVIIHGKGFGDDLYAYFYETSTVTIGGVKASLVPFEPVTDTAITAFVPEFSTLTGDVVVRVGEDVSNAVPFTATLKTAMTVAEIYGGGLVTGYFANEVASAYIAPLSYEWYVDEQLISTEDRLGGSGNEILLYDSTSGVSAHIRFTVTDAVGRVGSDAYTYVPGEK